MKKSLFAYAMLAVAALAFTSCSSDSEEDVDYAVTASFYVTTQEILWTGHEDAEKLFSYSSSDFAEELQKLGYYEKGTSFYGYTQETTKSQQATVYEELAKKWVAHYTEVLPQIDAYDFSARISDDMKKESYSFEYEVKAPTTAGLDISIWICVCNPQLVKGMTYKAEDASCPVQSITIDNGELNHFTTHKTATVAFADGSTKTMSVNEIGDAFMLDNSSTYGFNYKGEKFTDQSEITLHGTNYVLKLQ